MIRLLCRVLCLTALLAFRVQAAEPALDISAADAHAAAQAGKLTVIDIRTPAEWRETGVGQGVQRIDMLDARFEAKLREITRGDKSVPIALICRTGNRSAQVQRHLRQQGHTRIYNVREGMAGSSAGPGWIARGLPVEACRNC